MAFFKIKVTATIIEHNAEAETYEEAVAVIMADLSTRFSANTEILSDLTIIEDMTGQ